MMEEYEEMDDDAPDAANASNAPTAGGGQDQAQHQGLQIARQLGVESERNQLGKAGVLQATSGNAVKRLKNRQESRVTTRAGRTAKAAIKQIASQELQVEKVRIKEWKKNVIEDFLRELQVMKQTQEEAIEVQRQGIQVELEKVREELQQVMSESVMLKEEIKLLRAQNEMPKQRSEQVTTVIEKSRPTKKYEYPPPPKSYAQIAVLNSNENAAEKGWIEVTSSSRKKKSNPVNLPGLEPEKRRVIFRREPGSPQKLEGDLMLVLNESLQKTGIPLIYDFRE